MRTHSLVFLTESNKGEHRWMPKSMYSGTDSGRLIYGSSTAVPCCVDDLCLTEDLLDNFKMLLGQVEMTVLNLFPATEAKAPFVADMSVRGCLSYTWFVRLIWRKRNPNVEWQGTDAQILQLLDIYLANGWPWTGDKLFDKNAGCLPENLYPAATVNQLPTLTRGVDGEAEAPAPAPDTITKV